MRAAVAALAAASLMAAQPALAAPLRVPETGMPAFTVDQPPGWTYEKGDDNGFASLSAPGHKAFVMFGMVSDESLKTTTERELAESVFKAGDDKGEITRVEDIILAGLPGHIYYARGDGADMRILLVRLSETRYAVVASGVADEASAEDRAALERLFASIRLVGGPATKT